MLNRMILRAFVGALAVAVGAGALAAPAAAAAAGAASCRTVVTYDRAHNKTTAAVIPASAKPVHSFVFLFSDGDGLSARTYDKRTHGGRGYGWKLTVNGYAFQAYSYRAGQRCTVGGVTSAGRMVLASHHSTAFTPKARAAAVRCQVLKPTMSRDRTLDLRMTSNTPAGKKQYAYVVTLRYTDILGPTTKTQVRTFKPVDKTHHTKEKMPLGWFPDRVGAGAFGTPCTAWKK